MTTIQIATWGVSLRVADGGGLRTQAMVRALEKLGLNLDIWPIGSGGTSRDNQQQTSAGSARLHALKRTVSPLPLRLAARHSLREAPFERTRISLVPASHRWALSAPVSWLDYADRWSEFARREASRGPLLGRPGARLQAALWAQRERGESASASLVSAAAWEDANAIPNCTWLPTPVWSRQSNETSQLGDPTTAGMLANFDYAPNRDAYELLSRSWLPLLRDSGIRVLVAGYSSATLPAIDGIELLGGVASVDEFYQRVGIVLAPVRLGAGMKVKVVEALTRGRPVIATEHAVDGLPPDLRAACALWRGSDGNVARAREAVRALKEPNVRRQLDFFSVESFEATVARIVKNAGIKVSR